MKEFTPAAAQEWIKSGLADSHNATSFDTEFRAFRVSLDMFGAFGFAPFALGSAQTQQRVLVAPGFPTSVNDPQIEKYLAQRPYEVTRKNPGLKWDPNYTVNRK